MLERNFGQGGLRGLLVLGRRVFGNRIARSKGIKSGACAAESQFGTAGAVDGKAGTLCDWNDLRQLVVD
jgi:hypothetical protein